MNRDKDENDRVIRDFFERHAAEQKIAESQPDYMHGYYCTPTDEAIDRMTERLMGAYREVLFRRMGRDHTQHGPAIPGKPHCFEGLPGDWEACEKAHKKAERLRRTFFDMARSLVEDEEEDRDISLMEDGKPPAYPAPTERPSRRRRK